MQRIGVAAKQLEGRDYLMGDFTVADAYLFTVLRWMKRFEIDLAQWPSLPPFMARMNGRSAVKAALEAEGLS